MIPKLVGLYIVVITIMSFISFISYGIDKRYARTMHRRISERTLLRLAIFGGAPGAWGGMVFFRHKTRKTAFRLLVPTFAMIQIILAIVLVVKFF